MKDKSIIQYGPIVCAVNNSYHIMVPVKKEVLMSVTVGGKVYYNHSNGIRRSSCQVQRFTVPSAELDKAGEYTIKYSQVVLRLPYSCKTKPECTLTVKFKPVTKNDNLNIYHIADTHGMKEPAVEAGRHFGENLDLLILNGDISSSCNSMPEVMLSYQIAYELTRGEIPCVITRGNHDLRGKLSEKLCDLLPSDKGLPYYSARIGSLWLLVLDCGEDKDDGHIEYSGTAAFHQMRLEETDFIERLTEHPGNEYEAADVRYKLVVSHIPFTYKDREPFDIEDEIYNKWTELLRDKIKPNLILCGHIHKTEVWQKGGINDHRGQPCDVVIGSKPDTKKKSFTGAAINLSKGEYRVEF